MSLETTVNKKNSNNFNVMKFKKQKIYSYAIKSTKSEKYNGYQLNF